jgi:hypothetical protein
VAQEPRFFQSVFGAFFHPRVVGAIQMVQQFLFAGPASQVQTQQKARSLVGLAIWSCRYRVETVQLPISN